MRTLIVALFIFWGVAFAFGCSSSNPSQPNMEPGTSLSSNLIPTVVADRFTDGTIAGGMGTLGLFNISINPEKMEGEITPLRQVSLEDVLEVVDITNFMQLAPCSDCVDLAGISIDADGNLVVSIGLRHPFGAGDPLKPITGRNRGDLHIFNIEGTIFSDGSQVNSFAELAKSTGSVMLLNADGYSGYLDESIDGFYPTDSDLHPYILHFDDYSAGNFDPSNPMGFESVTTPPPTGNLVMAMGSDYDYQDYIFSMAGDPFDFTYAVACTYPVAAASKIERFTPEYRVPQHLKKAASEVKVEITRNQLMAGATDSEADIQVSVVDRSHDVAVGSGLDEMLAQSDVGSVEIEIPGVILSTSVNSTPTSGIGHDPSDPLIYDFTIQNSANADSGTYYGLVKVLDTYQPGQNTSPLLNGMDGIERVDPLSNPLTAMFEIDEFATYQMFTIDVTFENNDPNVGAVDGCPRVIAGIPFTFTVTADDPDPGQELTYYWDNGENTPGEYDDAETLVNEVEFTYNNLGTYTIDVRVEDGFGGVGYSSDPFTVDVLPAGTFVDADYTGGGNNGSLDYPYTDIQTGINNTTSGGYVYVLPADNHYSPFTISGSERHVMGFDLDCGPERPEIDMTTGYSFISSANNSSIDSFVFNLDINSSGGEIIRLSNSDNITFSNCRMTGDSAGGYTYVLRLTNITNSTINNNEWVTFRITAPPTSYRYAFMLTGTDCDYVTVMHNEMRDIGIPTSTSDTNWSGIYGVRFGYPYCNNVVVKNNLFYDFFDHSWAHVGVGEPSQVLHAASAGNQNNFSLIHNTIDDFDCNNGDDTRNAWSVGFYGAMVDGLEIHHNVFKSLNYYDGPNMIYHNSAGFWKDGYPSIAANYSCVYWGNPPPPGLPCQTYSYLNMITEGTGSYSQDDLVDPDFDYTPGATYYHPQNNQVATGGQNGDEMGCFGGPDGDWIPPSQIYN